MTLAAAHNCRLDDLAIAKSTPIAFTHAGGARGCRRRLLWLATVAPLDVLRPASTGAFPRTYLVWLAGAQASLIGDAALYFALGWAATAHGGKAAASVLTAITVPRTLLLLLGGAVGDRFGA